MAERCDIFVVSLFFVTIILTRMLFFFLTNATENLPWVVANFLYPRGIPRYPLPVQGQPTKKIDTLDTENM